VYDVGVVHRASGDDSATFDEFVSAARAGAFDAVVSTEVDRIATSAGRLETLVRVGLTVVDEIGVFDLTNENERLMARMQVAIGEQHAVQQAARRAATHEPEH
jgi:hypothetical protein